MKRNSFLMMLLAVASVLILSFGSASATLVPCCDGGFKPNKRCDTDSECQNVCDGGFRDGKPCETASECRGACIGGNRDGKSCDVDSDCKGGGTCGSAGTCEIGTCTALCEKDKPKETPEDPSMALLGLTSINVDVADSACP